MRRQELTLTKIGNSKGIRIPATVLKKYGIEEKLILEQRLDEIVLKPMRNSGNLSWHQTILEMAREQEDWSDWDGLAGDGLPEE